MPTIPRRVILGGGAAAALAAAAPVDVAEVLDVIDLDRRIWLWTDSISTLLATKAAAPNSAPAHWRR